MSASTATAAAYSELERRLANAENEAGALKGAADADEREARNIRETFVATTFFNGLQPTCCPRCEAAVSKDRIKREQTDLSCSVCAEPIPAEKMEDLNERLAEAEQRAAVTKDASDRATAIVRELKGDLKAEQKKMLQARDDLGAAPTSSSLRERREVELEIASLEGMLRTRKITIYRAC